VRGVQAAPATVRAGVPLLALLLAAGAAQVRRRPQGLRRQQRLQDAPGKYTKSMAFWLICTQLLLGVIKL